MLEKNALTVLTKNKNLNLRVLKGHFATSNSHSNYYIDVSMQKSRLSEAQAVANELVAYYDTNTIVDTILCLDGMEVVGSADVDGVETLKLQYIMVVGAVKGSAEAICQEFCSFLDDVADSDDLNVFHFFVSGSVHAFSDTARADHSYFKCFVFHGFILSCQKVSVSLLYHCFGWLSTVTAYIWAKIKRNEAGGASPSR